MIAPAYPLDLSVREEDTSSASFFQGVYQEFQQAAQAAGGLIDRFYTVGGYTMRLRFAGSALVPRVTPALEHLKTKPSASPALTICVWDSASTATRMPLPPWATDADNTSGNDSRIHYNDGRIQMYFPQEPRVSMLDIKSALGIFWTQDAHQLPYFECGVPLRVILNWWLSKHGRQFVHASAVGTVKGGVLLTGKAGSGKSTTALACLDSPLVYASDEFCLLATEPAPYVYSLYSSAKLNPDNVYRFPHLASAISNPDRLNSEKALLFLHGHHPEKLVTGFPLRALLLPHVTGGSRTTLTPVPATAALKALVPNTVFQLPGAERSAFRAMAKLVKQVPCFRLELGADLSQIPEVIAGLL